MATTFVHTCVRVRDPEASQRFYSALGFEPRGRLNFDTAYNIYMGLPGGGDILELTVNDGREEPYDLGEGYNHFALTVDDMEATLAERRRRAREAALPSRRPRRPADHRLHPGPGRLPDRADRGRRLQHPAGPAALSRARAARAVASRSSASASVQCHWTPPVIS